MFSRQSILNLTLPQWAFLTIPMLLAFITLLITYLALINLLHLDIEALEIQVPLPITLFPMQDFLCHGGAPVYKPKRKSLVWVTPLHLAAYFGITMMVKFLLVFYHVDICPAEGIITPLSLALFKGHHKTAKLLRKYGASPHAEYGIGPLHAAACSGLKDEIHDYIEFGGVDANSQCADGATPTIFALYLPESQALKTLSCLFENGAEADAQFGPESSWGLSDLASAMHKHVLASWLKNMVGGPVVELVEETTVVSEFKVQYSWVSTSEPLAG